jgi:hypothetical protein
LFLDPVTARIEVRRRPSSGIVVRMQWHWGNIGSALQGFAVVAVAIGALIKGPAAVRAWIDLRKAEAEEAHERAKTVRLDRQARLYGWSGHGVNSFSVKLVDDPVEIDRARDELSGTSPTSYVVLRVTGYGDEPDTEGGRNLRDLVEKDGYVSRGPTAGEKEALRRGLDDMGIPHSPLA